MDDTLVLLEVFTVLNDGDSKILYIFISSEFNFLIVAYIMRQSDLVTISGRNIESRQIGG